MAWTVPVAADLTQRRFAKAVGGDADEPRGSDLVVVTEVARTAASPNANVKRLWKRMMGLEPTTFCMASRRSSQLSYIREARGMLATAERRSPSEVWKLPGDRRLAPVTGLA